MTAPVPAVVPPAAYREEVVGTVPGMGEAYRRAVTGVARARLRRDRPGLPGVALRHGPVRADADRLADYQHLLGAPGTDELPAGFVHVLGFPLSMALLTRDDFPLPLLGLVHVANRVTQARALQLDEDLTFTAWADGLGPHRRGTIVDVHLTASVGDDVAWAGVSTYLAKGVDAAGGGGAGEGGGAEGGGAAGGESADRKAATEGEAASGPDVRERPESSAEPGPGRHVWNLGADTGRRYADVSGDRNPIHTSRIGAKAFGFPRPIAHGMYSAARALAEVPRPQNGALDWAVEFAKPVLLPTRAVLEFGDVPGGTAWRVVSARSGKVHLSGHVQEPGLARVGAV